MMTVQAQNALLKTIEEPPEYAVIMLLTENCRSAPPDDTVKVRHDEAPQYQDQLVKKYLMEPARGAGL